MSTTTYLKIGELAKQTGLAVGTLRYYSDLGTSASLSDWG